jgi:hypothetical protein
LAKFAAAIFQFHSRPVGTRQKPGSPLIYADKPGSKPGRESTPKDAKIIFQFDSCSLAKFAAAIFQFHISQLSLRLCFFAVKGLAEC